MTAPPLRVSPIVEGHGEQAALPVLIRRIGIELLDVYVDVQQPWRVPKGRMTKPEVLSRVVDQLRARAGAAGLVIAVVDADDDEPDDLRRRVEAAAGQPIACVVAVREYEAWLLAGQPESAAWTPVTCERVVDAKGRLAELTRRRYRETVDQASLTAQVDLPAAVRNSPSLARLVAALRSSASWEV